MKHLRAAGLGLALFIGVANPGAARGGTDICVKLYGALDAKKTLPATLKSRDDIASAAYAAGVPVMIKRIGANEIPVLLVNAESYPKIKKFLGQSAGTQIELQPNYNNDHGSMRVGMQLIDVDTPGARGYGEINETGIAWKGLDSYLPRRDSDSSVILEVTYPLDPAELQAMNYYQRVRRAAILRVEFTFNQQGPADPQPNLLNGGGEHCFTFCKGQQVNTHLNLISRELQKVGINDVNATLKIPSVAEFLSQAQKQLLDTNNSLKPHMLGKLAIPPELEAIPQFNALSDAKKLEALNYLVGYDATQGYRDLLSKLNVTGDMGIRDAANPRAGAILIYDDPSKAQLFKDGTYTTPGKFMSWGQDGQRSVPAPQPVPDPPAPQP